MQKKLADRCILAVKGSPTWRLSSLSFVSSFSSVSTPGAASGWPVEGSAVSGGGPEGGCGGGTAAVG